MTFVEKGLSDGAAKARPYSRRHTFSRTLTSTLEKWSSLDRLKRVEDSANGAMNSLKPIVLGSIRTRENQLNALLEAAENLDRQTQYFRETKNSEFKPKPKPKPKPGFCARLCCCFTN